MNIFLYQVFNFNWIGYVLSCSAIHAQKMIKNGCSTWKFSCEMFLFNLLIRETVECHEISY